MCSSLNSPFCPERTICVIRYKILSTHYRSFVIIMHRNHFCRNTCARNVKFSLATFDLFIVLHFPLYLRFHTRTSGSNFAKFLITHKIMRNCSGIIRDIKEIKLNIFITIYELSPSRSKHY